MRSTCLAVSVLALFVVAPLRYMGLLGDNLAGYDSSSAMLRVSHLNRERQHAAYNGQSAMLIQKATDEYLSRWMH